MPSNITSIELLKELLKSIPNDNSCMEWPRFRNRGGYGIIRVPNTRKKYFVHRLAYAIKFGKPLSELFVCHKCDNPACFRPDHLFEGNHSENMQDCVNKGRHNKVKLTPEDIVAIRKIYNTGKVRQIDLANKYGVVQTTISMIVRNKNWFWI